VPAGGFERDERIVVVAEQQCQVPVARHHRCEALRFTHTSMFVTAVSGLGFPDRPQFDPVTDLEPHLAEYRCFILSLLRFWQA